MNIKKKKLEVDRPCKLKKNKNGDPSPENEL